MFFKTQFTISSSYYLDAEAEKCGKGLVFTKTGFGQWCYKRAAALQTATPATSVEVLISLNFQEFDAKTV